MTTLSFTPPELDMLIAALRVAEVRRGWALQIRGGDPADALSNDDVIRLRERIEAALADYRPG